jgi:hypothetical protein
VADRAASRAKPHVTPAFVEIRAVEAISRDADQRERQSVETIGRPSAAESD